MLVNRQCIKVIRRMLWSPLQLERLHRTRQICAKDCNIAETKSKHTPVGRNWNFLISNWCLHPQDKRVTEISEACSHPMTSAEICWKFMKFAVISGNFRKFQEVIGFRVYGEAHATIMCTLIIKHMSWCVAYYRYNVPFVTGIIVAIHITFLKALYVSAATH